MTDIGALLIAIGLFMFGVCIDNGLTNIARAIELTKKGK